MSVGNAHHEFQIEDDGIHSPFFATYTNAANRAADTRATGPRVIPGDSGSAFRALVTEDINKVALQTDDGSLWRLTATTPTWVQIGGTGAIVTVDAQRFQLVGSDLRFSDNMESTMDFYLGAILETIRVTVTEAASVVSLNLDQEGGGDLTIIFSDGYFAFDTTPAKTVALTAGSDTSPTLNFVYVLQSTKTLTANTTAWPAAEHAPVATVLVQSAPGVSADGVYKLHEWTDHTAESSNNGHLAHINKWIRQINAQWLSGVDQTLTITPAAPDTVIFTTASGIVQQLHEHAFPAFSGTPDLFVVNDSVTPFDKISDLNALLTDSTGASMSGRYFSLVIWGCVSENTADSKLFVNLPEGSYANQTGVEQDPDMFADFSIPPDFKGTGFLIAELKLRHQASGGGDWTSIDEVDLRGLFPSISVGGGSVQGSEFVDNAFKIQDEGDQTKEIAFQASGITAATVRTATMPDRDITLGQFKSHLAFGDGSIGTSTTTRYLFPYTRDGATAHTVEAGVQFEVTFPGTALNLRLVQDAGVGAATITYTVRKNGSDQTLVIAGAATITTGSDLVNSFTFAAGDKLSVSAAKSGTITTSPLHVRLSMELLAS